MAELLVRVVDKGDHENASKAGDVIAVQPDGWGWSRLELSSADWRIVKLPGIAPESLTHLTESELDERGRMIARRLRSLDVEHDEFKAIVAKREPHTPDSPNDFLATMKPRRNRSNARLA